MADSLQYFGGDTQKRKYSPPPPAITLAKQKAQEIAARLYNISEPTKRPRLDNDIDSDTPPPSYAPHKTIEIPSGRVGVIIGKGGETIKHLQLQSGAKIQVTRDVDAHPNSHSRAVELTGTPHQIAKAEQLINDVLNQARPAASASASAFGPGFLIKIPNNKVDLLIGKGGETIKNMQATTGARIQVIPLHLPPGDTSTERTCQIDGTTQQIEAAKQLVNEVISENRLRNPSMGGYPQQGYQARLPTGWGQGGAMQQPGYGGYMQPGAYPGQNPQYNAGQAPYSGYPQPTTGGYGAGWDQASAPQNQQTGQGAGYDYYGQQPPAQPHPTPGGPGAPTENASYGYGQAPASGYSQGPGYGQDGYGGYSAAPPQSYYGSQVSAAGGYDQQQGYNSTSGASYLTPQAQKPPANQLPYGQQQQSPSAQAGSAPAYPPPAQSGYAQPDASGQQLPASYGAPTAQPGYAAPPYGAPAVTQQSYGQQHPPYNTAYGGGYSQPPAYGDISSGGSAPPTQPVKTSPQS